MTRPTPPTVRYLSVQSSSPAGDCISHSGIDFCYNYKNLSPTAYITPQHDEACDDADAADSDAVMVEMDRSFMITGRESQR